MTDKPALRFQRANYLVKDLDRALELYCGVLGFSIASTKNSAKESYSYSVFEIDRAAAMRFVVLSAPDQPRVMALTEIKNAKTPQPSVPRRAAIVLEIPDIDGVVAAARAKGFHVYDESKLVTQDGREGREVGIVDADDNLVVIYHITKAAD
ncbi:MAG: VOC family protein [Pseudomonadota bacterium]